MIDVNDVAFVSSLDNQFVLSCFNILSTFSILLFSILNLVAAESMHVEVIC